MATYVETEDLGILIDPGVALAPKRYGLPPHPIEKSLKERVWDEILKFSEKSDIVIVTHYHYDHYNPNRDLDIVYGGKEIFLKDYNRNINNSQLRRSLYFLNRLKDYGLMDKVKIADSTIFNYGNTRIIFSPPFYHGIDDRLGYVIMVYIEDGEGSFLYTSDVEGPYSEAAIEFIIKHDPQVIFLDGPPTYLRESFPADYFETSIANINTIILYSEYLKTIILDHHFMRDKEYNIWLNKLWSGSVGNDYINIMNAAEYMGRAMNMLEAYRDLLYERYQVDKDEKQL